MYVEYNFFTVPKMQKWQTCGSSWSQGFWWDSRGGHTPFGPKLSSSREELMQALKGNADFAQISLMTIVRTCHGKRPVSCLDIVEILISESQNQGFHEPQLWLQRAHWQSKQLSSFQNSVRVVAGSQEGDIVYRFVCRCVYPCLSLSKYDVT